MKYIIFGVVLIVLIFSIREMIEEKKFEEVEEVEIPDDVAFKQGYIRYLIPPDNFGAGLAWMQTIHDTRRPGKSRVEVDYIRFYARVGGKDILIASDEYNDNKVCGGLWNRRPWFGNASAEFPAKFFEGYLILEPYEQPEKVWHWWNCKRALIPKNVERTWMEARVRIIGPAFVQAGIDYWRSLTSPYAGKNVNNIEAAISDWHFERNGWQIITVAAEL